MRSLVTVIVFVYLYCLAGPACGQDSQVIDSLRAALRRPNLPDTSRIQAKAQLSTKINRTDIATAERLAQQALADARKLRYKRGEAMALNSIASTKFYTGDYLNAQRYFTECLQVATEAGMKRLQGHAYLGLGNVAGAGGDVDRALGYFAQAREAYAACRPAYLVGEALATSNIAGYLMNAGRLQEAARPIRQAIALAQQLGNKAVELPAISSLGRVQNFEGHPDSALLTWHEGRRKAHEAADYISETQILLNEVDLLLKRGEAAKALPLTQEAAQIARRNDFKQEFAWALGYMARAMHQLHMPAAFDTLSRQMVINDSINSEDRQATIAQLQVKFDVTQQQARIKVLEQQRRISQLRAERQEARTRLFTFLSLGLLLIVVGGALLIGLLVRSRRRLQTSEAALRQSNETKEQLMRIIGHDLRGPVASFQQLAPLLHDVVQQPDPADAHELIRLLDAGSQQLGALVDNLLHWTRVRSGLVASQPTTQQLAPVMLGVAALYEPVALLKGVRLEQAISPTLTVWADQDLLATILRNLLSNAIKFTPPGGTVWLSASQTPDGTALEVRDSGVGITPERLNALFTEERAASTPGTNGEPGTGLGLPLCARFVQLLGSTLQVESHPGAGTRFWFRLPPVPVVTPVLAPPHSQPT